MEPKRRKRKRDHGLHCSVSGARGKAEGGEGEGRGMEFRIRLSSMLCLHISMTRSRLRVPHEHQCEGIRQATAEPHIDWICEFHAILDFTTCSNGRDGHRKIVFMIANSTLDGVEWRPSNVSLAVVNSKCWHQALDVFMWAL